MIFANILGRHGAHCRSTYTKSFQSCLFQRWTDRRSKDPGYWKVDATAVEKSRSQSDVNGAAVTVAIADVVKDRLAHDLAAMEAEKERRLAQEFDEDAVIPDGELEDNTRSEWLRGCNWQRWFANKPLRLITNASKVPKLIFPAETLPLGSWCGLDYVSEAAEERKLAVISVAIWRVLDCSERTLQATPRTLRCWPKSWSHTYQPYDFRIPQVGAEKYYKQTWCRFISYIYRIYTLKGRLYEKPGKVSSLHLTLAQNAAMERVWSLPRIFNTWTPSPP